MDIPQTFDATLTKLLTDLPADAAAGGIRTRVADLLAKPVYVAAAGLRILPLAVETAVRGAAVGVSLWEGSGEGCLRCAPARRIHPRH